MEVSVVVASYNQFEETLSLLEHLTSFPTEVVMVNSGSDQADYRFHHWPCTVLHLLEDHGKVHAWKQGVAIAEGQYVILAQPQDRFLPHRITHQLNQIQGHRISVVAGIAGKGPFNSEEIYEPVKPLTAKQLLQGVVTGAMFDRRSLLPGWIPGLLKMGEIASSQVPGFYQDQSLKVSSGENSIGVDTPEVSIIVWTQNRFQGLLRTLKSLPQAEVLVVNRGSADLTYYNHDFPGVTLLHLKQDCTWNRILEMGSALTSGNWVALADDTCEWLPGRLKQQLKLMGSNLFSCGEVLVGSGTLHQCSHPVQRWNRDQYWDCLQKTMGLGEDFPELWDLSLLEKHNACIWFTVVLHRNLLKGGCALQQDQWDLWKWILRQTHCAYQRQPMVYHNQS